MMIITRQARISIWTFLSGCSLLLLPILCNILPFLRFLWTDFWHALLIIHFVAANGLFTSIFVHQRDSYRIAVRAGNLGIVFGWAFLLSVYSHFWCHFGWYLMALCFFHWSEYVTTALMNPQALTLESFLLDHSREYKLAAAASLVEFLIEGLLFPGLKQLRWISVLGAFFSIGGETCRKLSMFTARTNFNHHVQYTKLDGHRLVTHGIYRFFRHPSYVGWFCWSLGSQIILCNPICLVAYAVVSWKFFNARIYDEERSLLNFFGEDYLDYQTRVPTGIPFIYGYRHL